jgi:hypothetical protein
MNKINTKYEAWRLIHDQTRLFVLLYSKYGEVQEDFLYMITNQLIFNLPTSLNSHFKEIKYSNYTKEYLKRLYKTNESKIRIPKLSDYYKNYHLFFCRPILRHFKLLKMYRSRIIMNNKSINSFHIRNNVQNVPSRPSWNVTKVCKKNCNRSQIMNILHNNITQNLKGFEQILDHRDVSFFIFIEKKT